jgi:hypothetical protein
MLVRPDLPDDIEAGIVAVGWMAINRRARPSALAKGAMTRSP